MYHAYWRAAQPFVVSEKDGTWRRAAELPGLAALSEAVAGLASVSCASPGNCSAGGSYGPDFYSDGYPLVVGQRDGTWGNAQPLAAQQ